MRDCFARGRLLQRERWRARQDSIPHRVIGRGAACDDASLIRGNYRGTIPVSGGYLFASSRNGAFFIGGNLMRFITALAATTFILAGAATAQTVAPTTPKENPRVEQNERNKNKGNVENTNENDIKAKEQAPTTRR
jgi:hypothetical protein